VVVVVVVVVAVVVGAVVVVVGAGEAAACAGTITDFTTGFTQRSGNTSALAALPPSAVCKIRRRSVAIVKSPLRQKRLLISPAESNLWQKARVHKEGPALNRSEIA
jgi:hypothetical protein